MQLGIIERPAIVSNRFSIGFTNDYQLPLFEQFPLNVEFQRRLELIKDQVARLSPEDLHGPREQMVRHLVGWSELAPLELHVDRAWVRVQEEEALGGGNWFLAGIGFSGDAELWRM